MIPYSRWSRLRGWRPELSGEALALVLSVYFALACNGAFWRAVANASSGGVLWYGALAVILVALHALLLSFLIQRTTARPLLAVVVVATAAATYFMQQYNVYFDRTMLNNVLHTDHKEARELVTVGALWAVAAYAAAPLALLAVCRIRRRPWRQALGRRVAFMLAMLLLGGGALLLSFQDLSSLMRNHKEIRYLATPGNLIVGLARLALPNRADAPRAVLLPVAEDAHRVQPAAQVGQTRPRLLVLVIGETVRAQNWGLNGYARQTTPQLAQLDVVNFPDVSACGTSTEVSLPCMFSAWGRRDYDEEKILSHQSLLHVLERVGVTTQWRDNQTGCKGVCRDLDFISTLDAQDSSGSGLCDGRRCFDEILLQGLVADGQTASGDRVVVLHPLGNHGPAYFERYPQRLAQFQPACASVDLGRCTQQEIVNAYDNAVLYADEFLARTIAALKAQTTYDSALLYVSDHGESLGEMGLYLHGVPYRIAPAQQLKVPMVMWFSPGLAQADRLDLGCLRARAKAPASHDNLYSTVFGLFGIRSQTYDAALDLLAPCRPREQMVG